MKKFLKTALAILPLAVLAACSADEPLVKPDENIAQKTEKKYLRVSLVNASANPESRAVVDGMGEYDGGTEAENKIHTLDFYFYDADKQFHSYVSVSLDGDVLPQQNENLSENIYGFYHTNVPISLIQGDKLPRYVICIVNAVSPSFYQDKSMIEAQESILTSLYNANDKEFQYLGMNNSVYYGRDEVTGKDKELIMATPFDANKLKTATELENLEKEGKLEDIAINIYVERYAAKINLDLTDTNVSDVEVLNGTETVKLHFNPVKWDVNAFEGSFYFLKAFRTITQNTSQIGPTFETYDGMNGYLKGWTWNNESHHRSFWSRTPGYYADNYPLVADDVTEATEPYTVNYTTFNKATTVDEQKNYSKYVMETTLKGTRLTGEGMGDQYLPLTSIPSVVLVGQYSIEGVTGYENFYIYGKSGSMQRIFGDKDNSTKLGYTDIKTQLIKDQTILLRKTADGSYETLVGNLTTAEDAGLVVQHPDKDVRSLNIAASAEEGKNEVVQGLRIAADIVTLQVNGTNTGLYYYNPTSGEYKEIKDKNDILLVNRLLYQNLGGAHLYKNGMAFFSAPIQHWGWYRSTNENAQPKEDGTPKTIDDWDWSKMQTGDFGVVRNHVYTIKIGNIKGLGTGIKDETEALLPPAEKVGYEVHFHVNIQKWAVLPTQNWDW